MHDAARHQHSTKCEDCNKQFSSTRFFPDTSVSSDQRRRQLRGTGRRAPRLSTISFLVHFRVNLTANIQVGLLSSLRPRDQLAQMSATHSSFDQYCISHTTITGSRGAAAAPGPKDLPVLSGVTRVGDTQGGN